MRIVPPVVLALTVQLVVACSPPEPRGRPTTISRIGDTTVVTIGQGVDTAATVVREAELLWRDPGLGDPASMAISGGRLFIADSDRLHILTVEGVHLASVGRAGQGPQEFGRIVAIGASRDRVVALDGRNARWSLLDTTGAFIDARRLERPEPYVNPSRGDQLRFSSGEVLWLAYEIVRTDRRTRSALIASDPEDGTARILEEREHRLWVEFGAVLFPAEAFSPESRVAVSADGRMAWGDGMDYCVSVRALEAPGVTRVCRARPRAPVTAGIRGASTAGLDIDPRFSDSYAEAVEGQELADFFPSYDRLAFGENGRLWVRTVGREAPDVHPTLLGVTPDVPPWPRRWEAYDAEGRPAGAVVFPSSFDPRVFTETAAYGFLELPTGEVAIGGVDW